MTTRSSSLLSIGIASRHWSYHPLAVVLLVCLAVAATGCGTDSTQAPYEPEEALSTLEVPDGFRVELVVAEPMITDPVAMEIDPSGQMYVAEDSGYPQPDSSGQVTLLRDTNGDGRFDTHTVFADGLRAPRGILTWKAGVLVADAPTLWYFEDRTGNGKADVKRKVVTGFYFGNPQLGVNNPIYGLNNWIQFAMRVSEGDLHFLSADGDTVASHSVGRQNIEMKPDEHRIRGHSSNSQFGHAFDRWGHHFLVSNADHIYYEVIGARYLDRNPHLLVESATESISDHGAAAEVFPITENPEYAMFTDVGVITSACGLTTYIGEAFPSEYRHASFVTESVHNLVHADRLRDKGPSFVASRIQDSTEFLASTDSWFRPVNLYVGPDGALYVLDMYRDIIEQPRFLSEEMKQPEKLFAGSDRGRIYRVVPEDAGEMEWPAELNLTEQSTAELVETMDRDNKWWLSKLQQLLVQRDDPAAVEPLKDLARNGSVPAARVRALWTLEGMGVLETDLIASALKDPQAGVRENAIRLAEDRLNADPELVRALLEMESDDSPKVQYQLLATLGGLRGRDIQATRQRLLFQHIEDRWMQVAALTAEDLDATGLFQETVNRFADQPQSGTEGFFKRLSAIIGSGNDAAGIRQLMQALSDAVGTQNVWWRAASLQGLADGLQRRSGDFRSDALRGERDYLMSTVLESEASGMRDAALELLDVVGIPGGARGQTYLRRAEALITNDEVDPERRVDGIELLLQDDIADYESTLRGLIQPAVPSTVQEAAIQAIGEIEGVGVAKFLLERWDSLTPALRQTAVGVLMDSQERIALLLDALETKTITSSAISWQRTKRLMLNDDPELRKKARRLLGGQQEARKEILQDYQKVTEMEGDPQAGKQVYNRACARCHQIGGAQGVPFGPDLATVRNHTKMSLLTDILMPNQSIAAGYEQWVIHRDGGEPVRGIITSETPTAVTIRDVAGAETTVPRTEIDSMRSIDASAMPTGLEQQITVQEMADLLAFLRQR